MTNFVIYTYMLFTQVPIYTYMYTFRTAFYCLKISTSTFYEVLHQTIKVFKKEKYNYSMQHTYHVGDLDIAIREDDGVWRRCYGQHKGEGRCYGSRKHDVYGVLVKIYGL